MNEKAVLNKIKLLSKDEIKTQIKPLSQKPFVAFWQSMWRKWLSVWYNFSDKHPRSSKLIYQIVLFVLFSQGVTIFQFILFLFLPQVFGMDLASKQWLWPGIELFTADTGQTFYFHLLGKPVLYEFDAATGLITNKVLIGGGLGYFFAFLIATFLAQVINFPLQRNITFKSHGNPYYQAMWYFIGWVFIQPFCDGLASLYNPLVNGMLGFQFPPVLKTLLDTVVMGGVAMTIFFFVFLIIFPDYVAVEKRTRKKLEKLIASGAPSDKLEKVQVEVNEAAKKARFTTAEKNKAKAESKASSKAISYLAAVKNSGLDSEVSQKKQIEVSEAVLEKEAAIGEFEAAKMALS